MSRPQLSVVIPAYNEATRLPASLARIRAYLDARGQTYEIMVADDGSRDGTDRVAVAAGGTVVRVLRSERNHGKGHAVRRGMLAAAGERRLMSDADLSTPVEELSRLEAELDAGYDVAIGSRALPGATIEVHQSRYREGVGRLFNWCVRRLLLPQLHDTQCGFKLFSAAAAEHAFSQARLDGFCFDVEALFLAERAGCRIAERPVVWRNDAASRVTLVRGALAFFDLLRIRWNARRGLYGPVG